MRGTVPNGVVWPCAVNNRPAPALASADIGTSMRSRSVRRKRASPARTYFNPVLGPRRSALISGRRAILSVPGGITGGFAPPTPEAIHTLTRPLNKDTLNITSAVRETGTPGLESGLPKSIPHPEALADELHTILKELPTEQPPGSQDIYGMDISIAWGSDDLMWCNGGPQGCGGGESAVQATAEQKTKFKRAVEIVEQLVAST